jgi:cytochrome P450
MTRFRKYLNLKAYTTFEEWNPDKETARAAQLLYGHIDNLELYPGLMAECTKPPVPGSGVCPGQTTGRGILDDAVSLVRGDRFLSYDFNSNTLTNYGAALLAQHAPGSYGTGMLPRLILNALPGDFTGTSSYALLAFYTPEAQKEILTANKVIQKYDVARPADSMEIVSIQTQAGCKQVLEDHENFKVTYQHAIRDCSQGHDFLMGWDESKLHDRRSDILKKALFETDFEKNVSEFFADHVNTLIRYNTLSFTSGKRSFDFARDVANIVPIEWLAERFAIPIKTVDQPKGIISIYDAFNAYLSIYRHENFNLVPVDAWALREAAVAGAAKLRPVFETHIKSKRGLLEGVVEWLAKGSGVTVGPHAERLYRELHESKLPVGDLVADCIGMTAPVAANLAYQASLLVHLYLGPGYETDKARLVELAAMEPAKSETELQGFVFEGMRVAGAVLGVPRVATKDVTVDDGARGKVAVKAGHTVLVATSKAAMDPAAIPDPGKIDPQRKTEDHGLFGYGLHTCFGRRLVGPALAAVLRQVFKLKNVRRARGKLGGFTTVEHDLAGLKVPHYLDSSSTEQPVPLSLTLEYDA